MRRTHLQYYSACNYNSQSHRYGRNEALVTLKLFLQKPTFFNQIIFHYVVLRHIHLSICTFIISTNPHNPFSKTWCKAVVLTSSLQMGFFM